MIWKEAFSFTSFRNKSFRSFFIIVFQIYNELLPLLYFDALLTKILQWNKFVINISIVMIRMQPTHDQVQSWLSCELPTITTDLSCFFCANLHMLFIYAVNTWIIQASQDTPRLVLNNKVKKKFYSKLKNYASKTCVATQLCFRFVFFKRKFELQVLTHN